MQRVVRPAGRVQHAAHDLGGHPYQVRLEVQVVPHARPVEVLPDRHKTCGVGVTISIWLPNGERSQDM